MEEPVIHDTTDDVYYAVDVCNLFSSLPIKHILMVESGVKDFLLRLIANHSIRSMNSDAPIPSVNSGSL